MFYPKLNALSREWSVTVLLQDNDCSDLHQSWKSYFNTWPLVTPIIYRSVVWHWHQRWSDGIPCNINEWKKWKDHNQRKLRKINVKESLWDFSLSSLLFIQFFLLLTIKERFEKAEQRICAVPSHFLFWQPHKLQSHALFFPFLFCFFFFT